MERIDYLDFDLQIERDGELYRAQVLNSPSGQADHTFSLPFSALELENFLLKLGAPRQGLRGAKSAEAEEAKNFGERLFDTVFAGEVHGCLRSSLDQASVAGKGLRLRLRLTDAPELQDLPWEYLYNRHRNLFYALSVETPLVRYLELPERILPLGITPPLRVLVMIASPKEYPPLDVEREWNKLRGAVRDLEARGLLVLERLEQPTLTALNERLRTGPYHVFHFVGHGDFDPRTQDGVLIMEEEDQSARRVSGESLSVLLRDYRRTLRLAILNACEGGRAARDDSFAGTAQRLIQQGIPAVIAMQFAIVDQTAIVFAQQFYKAIADGFPVDAAVTEARKVISFEVQGPEWGTPVLYMRAPDGHIFDVELLDKSNQLPPAPPVPDPPPAPPVADPKPPVPGPNPPPEPHDGTVRLGSPFYVERATDALALDAIRQEGATITIKGPRQIGKSSLLIRLKDAAESAGKRVAYLDFEQFDHAVLQDADQFFQQFCGWISDELDLENRVDEFWRKPFGNIRRCTRYVEHYLLQELNGPLVLAFDEVDNLFEADFRSDFFGMLRAWHNDRSHKLAWRQLDIVLVTSTEPYRLIENLNQSPFNVGEVVELRDFTPDQVTELNRRHGTPLTADQTRQLIELLGGHPYLIRRALALVAGGRFSATDLLASAVADQGPFDSHLSHYLMQIYECKDLAQGMYQIITSGTCADEQVFYRLQSMGMVHREAGVVRPRCRLYADFFKRRLHG
jgi:AAA-like domain/CHAT domain